MTIAPQSNKDVSISQLIQARFKELGPLNIKQLILDKKCFLRKNDKTKGYYPAVSRLGGSAAVEGGEDEHFIYSGQIDRDVPSGIGRVIFDSQLYEG